MSVLAPPLLPPNCGVSNDELYRFSVKQFDAMISNHILDANGALELVDGILFGKRRKSPRQCVVTGLLTDALAQMVGLPWHLRAGFPLVTNDSHIEPDLTVVKGARKNFGLSHPTAQQTPLVIEVADESLEHDRTWKLGVYARARIAIYWLVDVEQNNVEVYSIPGRSSGCPMYREINVFNRGDSIPVVLDGREVGRIAVKEILP